MSVRFSIIIATCDRPERLAISLAAIKAAIAEAGNNHQIVVVDNGRVASARNAVVSFQLVAGLDVLYLETEPRDKCKALNAGIAHAAHRWLAFTDDDCLPDATWLREASAYISRCPVRLFGGRIVAGDLGLSVPGWLKEGCTSSSLQSPAIIRYEPMPSSGILGNNVSVPLGANLFVEKTVFVQYGCYDEELWAQCGSAALGGEDAEFAMRVRSAGEPVGYCAEAVVVHPVYDERATLLHHLRWSYRAGVRDVILFDGLSGDVTVRYRLKLLVQALLLLACSVGRWELSECVGGLMKITNISGAIVRRCAHPLRVNIWGCRWFFWLWNMVKTHPRLAGYLQSLTTWYYANSHSRDLLRLYSSAYYGAYGEKTEQEVVIKKMQALALKRAFPKARRVLVGGCADGMLVAMLRSEGLEAFGFDHSTSVFPAASKDVKPFLRLGDMGKIPFSSLDHFDLLVAVDVVEHVPRNAIPSMVWQMFQLGVPFMALVINHNDLCCPGHVTMKPLAWWQKQLAPFFELDNSISIDRQGLTPVYSLDGDPDSQFTFWRRIDAASEVKA